jgi:hypothetical protein
MIYMNISELFEELQDNILEELNGELILEGNCIIWSYDLDRDGATQDLEVNDDDEIEFDFASATSPEELLRQGYDEDLIIIEAHIAQLDDYADWSYSDPEIGDSQISFKIF